MATIQQLKALYGTDSDDEAIGKAAKEFGIPAVEIAREVGVKPGGMWSNRFGGAIDSYQANLYDVAEHVTKGLGLDTASKWLGQRREANKSQAETSGMYAREQGAVDSFFDQTDANGNVTSRGVHGFGDAANWFGGLAAQSFPYLFEAAAGGVAGRALAGGAKLGLQLGKELGMPTVVEAASNSATRASIAGSVAASYPSSVGDILSNQREQIEANGGQGETNFGSALLGGVPHAALNAFDPSHRLAATGKFFKAPVDWFDNIPGWRGNAARMGATALAKGGEEGLNETGQELINQRFGRMAVDPNATMTSGDAMSRYLESFVGGAALGGVMGGAGGGWRRSEHYKPQTPPADPTPGASTDLLNTPPAAPPPPH